MAMLDPMVTVKLLATVGVVGLDGTVQLMVVALVAMTGQFRPSMVMMGVPELRLVPVRVRM
jgi:hypothetical protein